MNNESNTDTLMEDLDVLMPKPGKIVIGNKMYEIYPLPFSSWKKISDMFINVIKQIGNATKDGDKEKTFRFTNLEDVKTMEILVKEIQERISEILEMSLLSDGQATLNKDQISDMITLPQVTHAINIIVEQNFDVVAKNLMRLKERMSKGFLSERRSDESASVSSGNITT